MKALSPSKVSKLLETKYFAAALNGLLLLAISSWLLNQWLSKEINEYSAVQIPIASDTQTKSHLEGAMELADKAYALSGWHLFGLLSSEMETNTQLQPPIMPATQKAVASISEDSDLDLALKGLLSYDDGKGYALIATTGNEVRLFAAEDEVLEGYTLETVLTDHVLLRGKGRLLKLALPKHLLDLNAKIPGSSLNSTLPRNLLDLNSKTPGNSLNSTLQKNLLDLRADELEYQQSIDHLDELEYQQSIDRADELEYQRATDRADQPPSLQLLSD